MKPLHGWILSIAAIFVVLILVGVFPTMNTITYYRIKKEKVTYTDLTFAQHNLAVGMDNCKRIADVNEDSSATYGNCVLEIKKAWGQ